MDEDLTRALASFETLVEPITELRRLIRTDGPADREAVQAVRDMLAGIHELLGRVIHEAEAVLMPREMTTPVAEVHLSRVSMGLTHDDAAPAVELEVACNQCGVNDYTIPIWHVATVATALLRVMTDLRIPFDLPAAGAPPTAVLTELRAWLDRCAPGWDAPPARTH